MPRHREPDFIDAVLDQWRGERPDLDLSGMAVVLRVQQLAGHFEEDLAELLEPEGLRPWEFHVLAALRRAGALTPKELCRSAQLSSGAMTHRLDRLEERGVLTRATNPSDRRSVLVELTVAGRELVDGILEERVARARKLLEGLPRSGREELAGLLHEVLVRVDPHAE